MGTLRPAVPEDLRDRCLTLVRGTGEIASAVAHMLFRNGYPVVLHDIATPTVARRRMAFADAVFDGIARLAGITALRFDDVADLQHALERRRVIPVCVMPFTDLLAALPWMALVDARMRKHRRPDPQIRLAPLTVGLGPGFIAGETVTVAVETSWERLGAVVTRGATMPLQGDPQPLAGITRDRFIYVPFAGTFHTTYEIGQWVQAGEVVAQVDDVPLVAPVSGVLRGLTRDGVPVSPGTKVIEVDPRGWDAVYSGVGERPHRIAEGVLGIFKAVQWDSLLDEASARN